LPIWGFEPPMWLVLPVAAPPGPALRGALEGGRVRLSAFTPLGPLWHRIQRQDLRGSSTRLAPARCLTTHVLAPTRAQDPGHFSNRRRRSPLARARSVISQPTISSEGSSFIGDSWCSLEQHWGGSSSLKEGQGRPRASCIGQRGAHRRALTERSPSSVRSRRLTRSGAADSTAELVVGSWPEGPSWQNYSYVYARTTRT